MSPLLHFVDKQNVFLRRLRPATFLKKRLWHRRFPVNFAKFLRTPFLTEHLQWLPLSNYSLSILTFSIFLFLIYLDQIIVIRNGKIVWKLGPHGPSLLNNLRTAENSTQSFSTCNKWKQTFLRENQKL